MQPPTELRFLTVFGLVDDELHQSLASVEPVDTRPVRNQLGPAIVVRQEVRYKDNEILGSNETAKHLGAVDLLAVVLVVPNKLWAGPLPFFKLHFPDRKSVV